MSRWSITALVVTGAALVACADSAKVAEPVTALAAPSAPALQLGWENPRHEMPLVSQAEENAKPGNPGGGGGGHGNGNAGTGINYHGGPLLTAETDVVAVYWAASTIYTGGPAAGTVGNGSSDGSLVGYFLRNLGGSSYFNINSTYFDASNTHVANVVNYLGFWANNLNVPSDGQNVADGDILSMLQYGFDHGYLTYGANTVYTVFTAGTVNLGGAFGTRYCAYHTDGAVMIGGVSRTVLYAAMPYDYSYPGVCTAGVASPNGDPAADAEVNTLVHEIEEAATDPLGTGYWDKRGYENADKCAWKFGTTQTAGDGGKYNITLGAKNFLVQMNWVNAGTGGCLIAYP